MSKFRLITVSLASVAMLATACGQGSPSVSPSSTERPEYSGTRTEYFKELAACLQGAGLDSQFSHDEFGDPIIETSVDPDSPGLPPEDKEAHEKCADSLPLPPAADTPEKIQSMYGHEVSIYECVVEAGYVPDPPPSFEVYLEAVQSGQVQWMPFDGLDQDYSAARRACPGDPDRWY